MCSFSYYIVEEVLLNEERYERACFCCARGKQISFLIVFEARNLMVLVKITRREHIKN